MKTLIIALAALTATAGFAQEPAAETAASGNAAQTSTAPAKDPNERICRNIPQTSTRLGRKQECHTRAEWEAASQHTRDQMDSRRGN
jgi:hypothetical protein